MSITDSMPADEHETPPPPRFGAWAVAASTLVCGIVIGASLCRVPQKVFAVAALTEDSFAVCTAPMDNSVEGFFMLDFETGDLSGGVLNQNTSKFTVGYRHNVLKDLGFKAGKVKNPKFLLVSGQISFAGAANNKLAQSVLYVTDASTGVTAAYGVPWSTVQGPGNGPSMLDLVPLDVVKPRGGGDKAP